MGLNKMYLLVGVYIIILIFLSFIKYCIVFKFVYFIYKMFFYKFCYFISELLLKLKDECNR